MLTKLDLLEPVHFLKPAVAKMTDSGKKTCSDSAILRGRRVDAKFHFEQK